MPHQTDAECCPSAYTCPPSRVATIVEPTSVETHFRRVASCAVFALVVGAAEPARADITFAAGSLIIPSGSSYQSDCGAVAMYGLVYDVLRANQWLAANHYTPIRVYYTYKDTKESPNRCTPTNLDAGPAYTGSTSPVLHSDPKWNDGCDFELFNGTTTPVTLVTNTTATNAATDTNIATINTSSKTTVYPRWPTRTIQHTTSATTNVHTVRYLGGPFVIAEKDATTFLKLLEGSLVASDANGNAISFAPFRQSISTCSFGTTIGGYVRIHRAAAAFVAPSPKSFIVLPPRLALLATNGSGMTGTVSAGILEQYLQNAGLSYTGAQGCPPGGANVANATYCPNGGVRGQIFDFFDFSDLKNNLLAAVDSSGNPYYKMLWAPHWELSSSSSRDPNANEVTGITNVASFLNGQTGLMAECESISSFEGSYKTGVANKRGTPNGQFQTCLNDGSGKCSTSATVKYGVNRDYTLRITAAKQNCTDPTLSSAANCIYFGAPGDPYAQPGDYMWNPVNGLTEDFTPNSITGTIYRPGVLPLISGVASLDKTKLTNSTVARAMIVSDFVTRGSKDDDPLKGNLMYVAGHDLTSVVSGTKVVLQTLLLLGEPPPAYETYEVSRSTPVIAPVGTVDAIVQGTFENLQPTPPAKTVVVDADAAAFEFPAIKGHLRAMAKNYVTTAATKFSDQYALFDAATQIPAANYNGCSSTFGGTCRTVFTNLVGGLRPARTLWQSSNVTAIGALIGSDLSAATHATVMQRVLAGVAKSDGSGQYVSKLGGVDRSTVAVIPPTELTNATRPTIAYFGAADGMLHAVCASSTVGTACPALGKELWAFLPRVQIPRIRYNTQRIEGSPRVLDMFGDWDGTGLRSYRTILMFQTASGDPTVTVAKPAIYALDVTDPTNPKILWEYTAPASRGAFELGQGLVLAAGSVALGTTNKYYVIAQTNNGGTGGAGNVVTAIDIESGQKVWQTAHAYPAARVGANPSVPATGIPGGAVAIRSKETGHLTDVVFGTLYGDIWQLDARTGENKHVDKPLFRYGSDFHPFGAAPTLYSKSSNVFAVMISGSYTDLVATTQWSTNAQSAIGVSMAAPASAATLTETSGAPYVPLVYTITSGEKASSQAIVVGDEIYFTTDGGDVNAGTYGTTSTATGHAYKVDINTNTGSSVVITGGAGSLVASGTAIYASSRDGAQRLTTDATGTTGEAVNNNPDPKVTKRIWLRSN